MSATSPESTNLMHWFYKTKLIWLIVVAFVLRIWGFNFGLYHADEAIVVNHALAYGLGDLNPHFFAIPPLVSYYLFLGYGLFYIAGYLLNIFDMTSFQTLFIYHPEYFYWWGRIIVGVIPGTISVYFAYKLARYLWNENAAFWSALWFAINYLHVRNSHYIYVDTLMVLALIGCAYSAIKAYDKQSFKAYLMAGLWIGIATALKYNAALGACGLISTCLLSEKKQWRYLLGAGVVSMLVFVLLNPYSILSFGEFYNDIVHQSGAEGAMGLLFHWKYSILSGCGLGVITIFILGLYTAFRRHYQHMIILLSIPAAFECTLILFSQQHSRYALPLMPFIALIAGFGAYYLLMRSQSNKIFRIVTLALMSFAVIIPSVKIVQSNILFTHEDTRDVSQRWIESNIPSGSKLLFSHSAHRPNLLRSSEQWQEASPNRNDEGDPSNLKNQLIRTRAEQSEQTYALYYLSEESQHKFSTIWPLIRPDWTQVEEQGIEYIVLHYENSEYSEFYDEVRKRSKLIQRFTPYRNNERNYPIDQYATTFGFDSLFELLLRKSTGRVLELYQV